MPDDFRSLVNRNAVSFPDRTFLIDPSCEPVLELRYGELRQKCCWFNQYLKQIGLSDSSKVGFLLDNGYWAVIVMMGTMYSGHVTVPLNAVASKSNLKHAVENARVEVIFTSDHYQALIDEIISDIERPIQKVVVDCNTGFEAADDTTDAGEPQLAVSPQTPAMILHTSGTVGLPKGAVLTHKNLIAGGRNVEVAHGLSADDRVYCVLPLYHINGEVVTCVAPQVTGSSVVMPRKFSRSCFWQHVKRYDCTWVSIVPTIAKYLLDEAHLNNDQFGAQEYPKLRFGRSASSAMPAGMLTDFEDTFQIPMIETMGLTETAAPILSNPMPPGIRVPGSVGIPYGNEVRVVDGDGKTVAANEVGEFIIRGQNVIKEYYNDRDATQSSFTQDGWFKTGDRGHRNADGYHFVTGRSKELIIKGGENISPREIDDVLYHHTSVLEAGAFGYPDENYGQIVAVAVVVKPGVECTEQELIEFCVQRLGRFRSPSRLFFVDDLPKGPSGKIQRLKVAESLIQQDRDQSSAN